MKSTVKERWKEPKRKTKWKQSKKGVKKIIEIFKEKEFKVLIKNNKIPFVSGVSDFEILQA